jgi:hypothetical protein
MKKEEYDIFVNYHKYPTAENIFELSLLSIDSIKDECIFILDTNALFLPYSTGSQSLTEIKKVFNKLKKEKRLLVPGQVAREFANNRPEKLKEIFQQLSRKLSMIQSFGIGKYPLLEEIDDYKKVIEIEREINEKLIQYRNSTNILIDQVKHWTWNDPVSLIYRKIFTKEVILDIQIDREKIKENLEYRYINKIPPGFKDNGKPDDGIGDLLIWLTILEVAKTKKHVVFISGDEKNDWYHRSEKQALYPRYELITEFLKESDGRTFHILKLSELLNLFGASENAVKEVEIEEKLNVPTNGESANFGMTADSAVFLWLLQQESLRVNISSNNFDDYEVESYGGGIKSVAIIAIDNQASINLVIERVRDRMLRAYLAEDNHKTITKIQFVIVSKFQGYNFSSLNSSLQKLAFKLDRERVEFTFGYLGEQGHFIEVPHIWAL